MATYKTQEYRVIGPPGCGKTTWLGTQVENAVERDRSVLLASLTRAAAFEIADRNLPIPEEAVGTLHAHCYRVLGRPELAETPKYIKEWNREFPDLALSMGGRDMDEDNLDPGGDSPGDELLSQYMTSRARQATLLPTSVQAFATVWKDWKAANELLDFTDLIEMCLQDVTIAPGNPSVIFLDEAQDMDLLEMSLARQWGQKADYLIVVGDPDQNLYQWRGSDPEAFCNPPVPEDCKRVLSQSYRVPRAVHQLAVSWIGQSSQREEVEYYPRDEEGEVRWLDGDWRYVEPLLDDAQKYIDQGKSVMVLASCSYMLNPVLAVLRREGIPFHNPYRRKRGDWNPLHTRRDTVSSGQRLLSYLSMSASGMWSAEDVQRWTEVLKVENVFAPQTKREVVSSLYNDGDQGVPWELMDLFFSEAALEAGLSGDLDWFTDNLLKAKERGFAFPIEVARNNPEKLTETPRLIIGTIHSVKGGEADVVYLMPDLSQAGMMEWLGTESQQAAVYRLFYVGMTRARESLVLCSPATRMSVEF